MSTLILMPDGNAMSPSLIRSVNLFQSKKGLRVVCNDAQQRIIVSIAVADEVKGKRVRDILIQLAADGPRPLQPDWSFLDEEAVTG